MSESRKAPLKTKMAAANEAKNKLAETIERIDQRRNEAVNRIADHYKMIQMDRVRYEWYWPLIEARGAEIGQLGEDRRRLETMKPRLQRPAAMGAIELLREINVIYEKYLSDPREEGSAGN